MCMVIVAKSGQQNLNVSETTLIEDDPRPGRPADAISQEMIDRVERLMITDRRIKIAELASDCGFSNRNVYSLIHEHLGIS